MASISSYQQAWKDANAKGDKAGMDAAHKGAESIRAGQGYSGGSDGSQNISIGSSYGSSSGSSGGGHSGSNSFNNNTDWAKQFNDTISTGDVDKLQSILDQRMDKLGGTADGYQSGAQNYLNTLRKNYSKPAQGVANQYRQATSGYMDDYAAKQSAIRAEQEAKVTQNIANLNAQKPLVRQAGVTANKAAQQNYMNVLNPNGANAEQLAALGLSTSGLSEDAAIKANNSYMQAVNSNEQNVSNQLNAIELAMQNAKLTGDIATAQQLQSYYDTVLNAGMQSANNVLGANQWALTNSQNQNQQAINNAFTQAGVTGTLNGNQTMAGQQLSYTIEGMSLDNQLKQFELLLQQKFGFDQRAAELEAQRIANQGAQAGNAGQLLQNEYQRLYNQQVQNRS